MTVLETLIERFEVADAMDGFILDLRMGDRTEMTLKYYRTHFRYFKDFLRVNFLDEITTDMVKQYLDSKKSAPYVRAGSYRALRAWLNWCVVQGKLVKTPINFKIGKMVDRTIPAAEVEEVRKILAYCDDSYTGIRNRALVMFLFNTGCRLSEVIGIKCADLKFEERVVKVFGKGRKERIVGFQMATAKALYKYHDLAVKKFGRHDAFWLTEEGKPGKTTMIRMALFHLCQAAGIRSISAHKFRHGMAVNSLRGGMNIFDLQTLLGHSSLEMVKRYSKTLSNDDALKAQERTNIMGGL